MNHFVAYLNDIKYICTLNGNGKFNCPCPDHQGSVQYTLDELTAHFDDWTAAIKATEPNVKETLNILSPDLIDTESLARIGLCINTTHNLLICLMCQTFVQPAQVSGHLRAQHPSLTSSFFPGCIDPFVDRFNLVLQNPPIPTNPIPEIEGLVVTNILSCPFCHYFCPKLSSMRKHHKKKHSNLPCPSEWISVPGQHYDNSLLRSYFHIIPNMPNPPSPSQLEVGKIFTQVNAIVKTTTATPDVRNIPPWLRLTKWNEHIKGYDVKTLLSLAAVPSSAEFPILKLSLMALLYEASELIDETPVLILQKLNSPNPQKDGITNTPFHKHQDHDFRMTQYIFPVLRLLAMLLRTDDQYKISLPDHITEAVEFMQQELLTGDVRLGASAIFHVLRHIWMRKWIPTTNQPVVDPTVHFLILAALQWDGSFMEPKQFTNTIARLEYSMRLIFVKVMHESPDIETAADEQACWYQEKVESPFNTLRTLQHLLSSVAYATLSLPRIWWSDRESFSTLLYRGSHITISGLTSMLATLETQMLRIWEKDILLELPLLVEYDQIYDDISNIDLNYSFLHDPRNHCFQDQRMLANAIVRTPALRERFIAFSQGDVVRWNVGALQEWLLNYSRLQLFHLIRALTTSGSPSRGTELTAMLLVNTIESPVRNLVMMGKYLAFLCTYLKTSSITGHDKCIPHAADGFQSALLVQDLAIARPFAMFAIYLSHPNPAPVISLYHRHLFINQDRLFTTADITHALEVLTVTHLDVKLGVSDWRHVSTAFRRKLCSRMQDLFEEDALDSVQSMQSGHSRQTENRIYALSADSLLGAPEDLLPLFLECSGDWQNVVGMVPGGLGLGIREALASNYSIHVKAGIIKPFKQADILQSKLEAALQPLV